ncbi:leucine rich repeat protein [Aspergillus sclerotialis]|uniref:Leucine rich repeat protein n=1 Tax=Aspergillus sclerotialis TaxID=2070753 RepID=A0A3A2ZC88_9EURO|nr:leucine rich repeat protein [Aspergillus sclerotialis]
MGRLHYQARKIEGIKAGQVVSKDLKKRTTPGTFSKAAARDPILELDISGKKLTDDGLALFIDDLIGCIKFRDNDHPDGAAKVTELLLHGNELTTASLPKIAEVVALSAGDLREFNISMNNIQVNTPEEKLIWQMFLESFNNCYLLKKLDFGDNRLGTAGMEILARVFIHSDLDFLEADAEELLGTMHHDEESNLVEEMEALKINPGKENEGIRGRSKKTSNKAKGRSASSQIAPKALTKADLKRYACTRGLRSIPYLILSNTCTSNAAAIHLSSMLSIQRSPEHLLAFLPPGKALTLPDTTSQCNGIVWLPNDEIGPLARNMINMGESVRQALAEKYSDEEGYVSSGGGLSHSDSGDGTSRRKLQKKLDVQYTRQAKRVRMETLKNSGAHEVEIWITALKMMVVSRALLLEDKNRAAGKEATEQRESTPENSSDGQEQEHGVIIDTADAVDEVLDNKIPTIQTTDENDTPPRRLPIIRITSETEFELEYEFGVSIPSNEIYSRPQTPLASHQQKTTTTTTTRAHPNPNAASTQIQTWRYGLPFKLWRRIIAEAVGADGILNNKQQEQIMRYATDWDVIAYKLTIKGVEDYQQIWKFLETVDCFTYSSLG